MASDSLWIPRPSVATVCLLVSSPAPRRPVESLEPASDDRLLSNQAGEPAALLHHPFPARRILLIWQPQNDGAGRAHNGGRSACERKGGHPCATRNAQMALFNQASSRLNLAASHRGRSGLPTRPTRALRLGSVAGLSTVILWTLVTPGVDPGDATRGYPVDSGDTSLIDRIQISYE